MARMGGTPRQREFGNGKAAAAAALCGPSRPQQPGPSTPPSPRGPVPRAPVQTRTLRSSMPRSQRRHGPRAGSGRSRALLVAPRAFALSAAQSPTRIRAGFESTARARRRPLRRPATRGAVADSAGQAAPGALVRAQACGKLEKVFKLSARIGQGG